MCKCLPKVQSCCFAVKNLGLAVKIISILTIIIRLAIGILRLVINTNPCPGVNDFMFTFTITFVGVYSLCQVLDGALLCYWAFNNNFKLCNASINYVVSVFIMSFFSITHTICTIIIVSSADICLYKNLVIVQTFDVILVPFDIYFVIVVNSYAMSLSEP